MHCVSLSGHYLHRIYRKRTSPKHGRKTTPPATARRWRICAPRLRRGWLPVMRISAISWPARIALPAALKNRVIALRGNDYARTTTTPDNHHTPAINSGNSRENAGKGGINPGINGNNRDFVGLPAIRRGSGHYSAPFSPTRAHAARAAWHFRPCQK